MYVRYNRGTKNINCTYTRVAYYINYATKLYTVLNIFIM